MIVVTATTTTTSTTTIHGDEVEKLFFFFQLLLSLVNNYITLLFAPFIMSAIDNGKECICWKLYQLLVRCFVEANQNVGFVNIHFRDMMVQKIVGREGDAQSIRPLTNI